MVLESIEPSGRVSFIRFSVLLAIHSFIAILETSGFSWRIKLECLVQGQESDDLHLDTYANVTLKSRGSNLAP